jgi:carboxypeptidase C (cathepsin A)
LQVISHWRARNSNSVEPPRPTRLPPRLSRVLSDKRSKRERTATDTVRRGTAPEVSIGTDGGDRGGQSASNRANSLNCKSFLPVSAAHRPARPTPAWQPDAAPPRIRLKFAVRPPSEGSTMHARILAAVLGLALATTAFSPLVAAAKEGDPPAAAKDDGKGAPKDESAKDDDLKLPPFPADRTVHQAIQLGGRTVNYDATVGSLPVLDEKGKTIANVMFTAYTVAGPNRAVTFALNGGPGASSVYLNLGAIGPKRVQFGAEGNSPSDPATLADNAGTWLDFTDLVFIDPVGTGFSYSRVKEDEAKKRFYNPKADIEYLSRIVFDWLVKNERLQSRKYLVGESYGGFRGPRMTHFLQTRLGIAMNGLVLVSPYLDPTASGDGDLSPLPWMLTLPTIAAANLERHSRLSDATMAEIINYTRTDYVADLLKGRSDPQSLERIVKRVTDLSGLDPTFVRRSGGRLETQAYLREVFRADGKLGSRYDSNVTAWDPFPFAPSQRSNDPILDSIIAPTTTAMVDFITRTVGWKYAARYNALSYEVNGLWSDGSSGGRDGEGIEHGSVKELREAVAVDPKLNVLIVHGWGDLSCPFMASVLIVDQMPIMGNPARVQVKEYAGGHMFYSRGESQLAMRGDVMKMYAVH